MIKTVRQKLKQGKSKYPVFSFKYYDKANKQHSFVHFDKGKQRDKLPAYESLLDKLTQLSSTSMLELSGISKNTAFETLSYNQFNENLKNVFQRCELPPDSKLTVFRFCNQQYRIICSSDDNIFYIIAFDFNYSAYKH